MKIFGHEWIESESFFEISTIEGICKTSANSILKLAPLSNPLGNSLELSNHCRNNAVPYALEINSIEEAMFSNLLKATYVVCEKELAKELMPIAQNYLFDTQVLAIINKSEIEEMARSGVDGVIIR